MPVAAQRTADSVSLSGNWRATLDRDDLGIRTQIFMREFYGPQIQLPGILQAQRLGDEISTKTPWVLSLYDRYWFLREDYKDYLQPGKVKVPFLSQPPLHYVGVAWYQRQIDVPREWVARRVVLTLERPHWETTVWIDGQKIGSDKSLVAPHVYDLGTITPGRHRLTIRVDNRMLMPYRPDAHSVSDSVGGNWNGIVGKIELSTTGRVWIDEARVFPNLKQLNMLIKVRIGNVTGRSGAGTLTAIWPDVGIVPVSWDEHGGTAEVEVPIRLEAPTWDEFHTKTQPLKLWLKAPGVDEELLLNVGLREFHAEGKEFILNGHPIIFRGTNNSGDFPLTGYPPTDVASWKKIFETCRTWGLNHMRFHSWCPPEATFEAADQVGFYLQAEAGMWNEISPDTPMEKMLYEETDRMIKAYGNHPSFMLLSASNEPKGKWKESLSRWVERYRREDPRRLYTTGTGHTEREILALSEGTDYLAIHRNGGMMLRRESGWFGRDYAESLADVNVPVIAHEVGQWAAYPDYDIIKKFTGYLRPGNYEIFRDSMKAHGLLEKNWLFAVKSGQFQFECYKEEIEANLRTPGLSGFQLLDLHDYLGQGTSPVGLLDAFWESKNYASAEEFKKFCNSTVPLARLPGRVFTTADTLNIDVDIAHYGPEPIENGKVVWRIPRQPPLVGEWETRTIPIGKTPMGKISIDLSNLGPGDYTLIVTVAPASFFQPVTRTVIPGPGIERGKTYFENEWSFTVYPGPQDPPPTIIDPDCPPSRLQEILVTSSWEEAEARLSTGGKVLFVPRNSDLDWTSPPLDSVPIFWNRLMTPAWSRMLGLWVDAPQNETRSHTLMGFSGSSYFDWQWAQVIFNVRAINLERLPSRLEPTVWAIDDWNRNYKLGLIFEGTIGDGRLLVSAFDVTNAADPNPVAQQLRRALLTYMKSDCFQPNLSVTREEMRSLFFDTQIMKKLGATAKVEGVSANTAIDGDPNTFVLVGDQHDPVREQVDLVIGFPKPVAMSGLVLMPRQNHREHEGDIREYMIQRSDDGIDWHDVRRGDLPSTFAPQQIQFARTITTKYLKLISLTGFGVDKTTSLSELAVIYAGPKLEK